MGNRALVIFTNEDKTRASVGTYLHWNGGPESVFNFLKELDRREIRRGDLEYESARFIQLVGDWMDQERRETLSLGAVNIPTKEVTIERHEGGFVKTSFRTVVDVDKVNATLDHGDNGIYWIDRVAGTYEAPGMYRYGVEALPLSGDLETAYAVLEGHDYTIGLADTFAEIDQKLYGDPSNGGQSWNGIGEADAVANA